MSQQLFSWFQKCTVVRYFPPPPQKKSSEKPPGYLPKVELNILKSNYIELLDFKIFLIPTLVYVIKDSQAVSGLICKLGIF
jgi:hypothetical protein